MSLMSILFIIGFILAFFIMLNLRKGKNRSKKSKSFFSEWMDLSPQERRALDNREKDKRMKQKKDLLLLIRNEYKKLKK